jgi:hypothetical protein
VLGGGGACVQRVEGPKSTCNWEFCNNGPLSRKALDS